MTDQLAVGPYRATILWNGLIRNFRGEIPLGRHRRYMKTYDDCFVASEAVEWLHQYLKKNPNFGTDVSRAQTVQLLQKLHKARVFEDVRGTKHNRGEFTDSGRLFKLTQTSPTKTVRTPIALRNNLKLANLRRSPLHNNNNKLSPTKPVKLDFSSNVVGSMPSIPDNATTTLPECHFVSKPLSPVEIEEEWKKITVLSLQKVLGVDSLDDIMDTQHISGRNIMHNCLYINKSGVVTNIDPKDQLPHWALSAMKCLAYWPDKTDENLPNYPGFEKDVFRVVKDYFCGLQQPLMTYEMYDVITNVFVCTSATQQQARANPGSDYPNSTPITSNMFQSVENLLMSISKKYTISSECQDVSEGYSSSNILDLSPIHHVSASTSMLSKQKGSDGELPVTRYETAFGPDNKTVTRVFYGDGVATDINHAEGRNASSDQHTPIETHFDESPTDSESSTFSRKSGLRHSVHNLFSRGASIRDKKVRREKTMCRRRSAGHNLNEEKSYGCTVGVFAPTGANTSTAQPYDSAFTTPVSRHDSRHDSRHTSTDRLNGSDSHKYSRSKPPAHPRESSSLYPDSQYPKSHQPVIEGGARKHLKRKKSLSVASLLERRSFMQSSDSGKGDDSGCSAEQKPRVGGGACDKDSVPGRSLSLSDLAVAPPIENELQKQCLGGKVGSDDSVLLDEATDRIVQALQLVCLLIPPANRRRLHLLLRLMNKISNNEKLVLDEAQPSRNLLLETFYRAVLTCADESQMDDLLVLQLLAFLVDHYTDIMAVPAALKTTVEQRLIKLQRTKDRSQFRSHIKQKHTKIRYSSDDSSSMHYCQQVSLDEYENQKMSASQQALATLLEDIVSDKNMAVKDKKKKLKQFQKLYPDIYLRRFPSSQSEMDLFPPQPRIKQPLLARPLLKLKGLRL